MRILLAALLTLSAWGQDWAQFRGSAAMTGVATGAGPEAPLRVLWQWEGGESVESSAAIVGGAVYFGTGTGELVALDLETGKLRWKYKAGESIGESSPAVSGGIVYIGDLEGVVHAVRAANGQKVWTFKTSGEVKASPVVAEGKVVIGSYDGSLYGLDALTGKLAWTYKTEGQVHSSAAVVGGRVVIGTLDGRVLCLGR